MLQKRRRATAGIEMPHCGTSRSRKVWRNWRPQQRHDPAPFQRGPDQGEVCFPVDHARVMTMKFPHSMREIRGAEWITQRFRTGSVDSIPRPGVPVRGRRLRGKPGSVGRDRSSCGLSRSRPPWRLGGFSFLVPSRTGSGGKAAKPQKGKGGCLSLLTWGAARLTGGSIGLSYDAWKP